MEFISLTINGFEVRVAFDENSVHVYNAYPIKDDLKLRGYRWDPNGKSWYYDKDDVKNELSVLKNNLKIVENKESGSEDETDKDSKIPKSSSVAELKQRLQTLISNSIGGYIWVRGIIASELKNYSWASYFDLRDEDEKKDIYFSSEIKSTHLSSVNYKLKKSGVSEGLEKDLPVLILASVNLSYKKNVDIRLSIIDILPEYTREKIKSKRDITVDKLKAEGIFDNQKKLTLPLLVRNIGLISSEQGTSIRDIISGMGKYKDKYNMFFIDARMEGDNGVKSIVRAIEYFENSENSPDLIVIARGGGSEQSLSMFNDYDLCRKVCRSDLPILTAIGHEKDLSAIELCSYLTPSPATPSGIGKYFYDRYSSLEENLSEIFMNLYNSGSSLLNDNGYAIKRYLSEISIINKRIINDGIKNIADRTKNTFFRVKSILQNKRNEVIGVARRVEPLRLITISSKKKDEVIRKFLYITDFVKRIFKTKESLLKEKQNIINISDPKNILRRGFTMTLNTKGKIISSKKNFKEKDAVLRFYDGEVKIKRSEEND